MKHFLQAIVLLIGSIAFALAAAAQLPLDCPDGCCRRIAPHDWSPITPAPTPPLAQQPDATARLIEQAVGYCKLRVLTAGQTCRLASAVVVGRGDVPDEWIVLSAGHIFAGLDVSQPGFRDDGSIVDSLPAPGSRVLKPVHAGNTRRIELSLHDEWLPATLLDCDRSPDRAVFSVSTPKDLRTPPIAQGTSNGPAVMIGFPRGDAARAFAGQIATTDPPLAWLSLVRTSHYDLLVGTSGGGVYDEAGRLIGIQSCTDSAGQTARIGYTPISAWDALFAELGCCPRGWGRSCRPPDSRPQPAPLARGPQGELGPQGERGPCGPAPTPEQIRDAVAAYLAEHPPQIDPHVIEQAVARALKQHTPPPADFSQVDARLDEIEQRLDVPFEVRLFNDGTKVGGPRSVRPHGGYLPLDVFGEIETPAGPDTGE